MLDDLIKFIGDYDGKVDKKTLAAAVSSRFSCIKARSVYYTNDFAIRFSSSASKACGNTVLALSVLKKYDHLPFVVCVVTPQKNYLLLANTSCLSKISQTSHKLAMDNIKGSFNGPDIMRVVDGVENKPENFQDLFTYHKDHEFEENLARLVESTHNIVPTGHRFEPSDREMQTILDAPARAHEFSKSSAYKKLQEDLDNRVQKYQAEILMATSIEDVKTRGNIIEYLISGDDDNMKTNIMDSLRDGKPLPKPFLRDGLGDYSSTSGGFHVEIDIKSKIMTLPSAPKGYNLDKILKFLAGNDTVFMIYFVGVDRNDNTIKTKLVSMFQTTLLSSTKTRELWAGRNSRGVSQFNGDAIKEIILHEENIIDVDSGKKFLEKIQKLPQPAGKG